MQQPRPRHQPRPRLLRLRRHEDPPMNRLRTLLNRLLGDPCQGCNQRVYPRDAVRHYANDCPAVNR
ncbi:uncharacterized protein (Precursor) [Nocardioides sp. PD653]|nr:uncharacterized protein (Precursor) [Nocardioides sp. PD653]